ncbi:heme ABC transporter ATP-binding protein [Oceanisphaera pacifica]|uniref:Heme ABC transporter ATP-binding protein n=1 Tax=Oceanisphaera pacifica TaxID=2818389 RepID=A0ABS3NF65_9GAMM|nr:heme ABC transporter ATP-binding protein [Oceanisphaera pacifica]MBO1518925.1 heme ABC transporter ATP-binding protein [Oceanisphaera pacifica]
MKTPTPLLDIQQLSLTINRNSLLSDINLQLVAGQVTALIGANGAGKSTLFKCIAGEHNPSGTLKVFGRPREQWSRQALARQLAVLPQQSALQFPFLAREVVSLGRIPHQSCERDNLPIIQQAMEQAKVWHLRDAPYPRLSGGEKQRVHFARILAQLAGEPRPRILLLDEPTSALDLGQQHQLLGEAQQLAAQGCAVLIIVHDLNLAARYADQLVLLDKGHIVSLGSPEQVLTPINVEQYFGYRAQLMQSPHGHQVLV